MCTYTTFGVAVAVVAAMVALATFYPPPPLSDRLQAWRKRGNTMRFGDHNIFYMDVAGSGSHGVLVLLHGFPTFSWDWSKILPGLQKEFSRIVLLDYLGFGLSDKPVSHTYTTKEQADIVEHVTRTLSVRKAHVMSHDYGDTVALELLARHNAATSTLPAFAMQSLTMLNGGVFIETLQPRPMQKLLLLPVIGPILGRLSNYPLFRFGFGEVFGDKKPSEEDLEDFYAGLKHKNGHFVTAVIQRYLHERQTFADRWVGALKSTQISVLMIYGPADPVNPPVFADHFRKTVPQHKLAVLKDSVGHYPQWEDPESVLHHFSQFLQTLNPGSVNSSKRKQV